MQSWGSLALVPFLMSWMISVPAWPQNTSLMNEQRPAFDAVSIRQIESSKRISSPGSTSYIFTRHKPCVYLEDKVLCQLALGELIWEAYQRKRYEVTGPTWLMEDVFVFQAILPERTSKEDARLMMQRALEERFGLRSHVEKKLLPVYEIVVGPGGQHLTPADPPDRQKKINVDGGPASYMVRSAGKFAAVAMRLDELGYWIESTAGLDRPVLNATGLDERYKIDLHWDPADETDSPSTEKDTGIVGALKKQAGLVLRKQDAPVDILVIDRVNRTPTPN